MWDPHTHPGSWRAIWVYSKKRAARDNQTLTAQANRARAVIAGEKRPKGTRFVTVHQGEQVLDEASLARARYLQDTTGISIARIVRELRSLQEVTINLNGHHLAAAPRLTDTANDILTALSTPPPAH